VGPDGGDDTGVLNATTTNEIYTLTCLTWNRETKVQVDDVISRQREIAYTALRDLKSRASQQQLLADFQDYLDGFSPNVQDIIDNFKFRNQLSTLSKADAIGTLINEFLDPEIDLSPQGIDNHSMGTVFEELVRKFNEENNEEAGEHWTPRDAVRLMANLVFLRERNDEAVRWSKNVHRSPVEFAGLSSDVGQDAEARKPASEQPGDPVGEGNVDLRQPSLTKPHHEHARGGDGDDYDGCGIHGFSPNLARTLPAFDGGVSDSSYAS
jgi:hypothetical protein